MTDDIVTRLQACWCDKDYSGRGRVDPYCDHDGVRSEAADEIKRLRKIIHDFYFEEAKYQDAMNSNFVEEYIIPQSWKDAYTAFEKEAQKIEFGDD